MRHPHALGLALAVSLAVTGSGIAWAATGNMPDMPMASDSPTMADMPGMSDSSSPSVDTPAVSETQSAEHTADSSSSTPQPSMSPTPAPTPTASKTAALSTSKTYTIGSKTIKLSQPVDPQLGKLKPTEEATTRGMFGPQEDWPLVPIHAALSRDGHLISYGTPVGDSTTQGGVFFDNWDSAKGFAMSAHVDTSSMGYDSFCNSLMTMQDGRILMVGGNSSMSTMIYNPITGAVDMGADLNLQRWYATTLRLTDGRMLVLGGTERYDLHTSLGLPPGFANGTTPEIGDGINAWKELTGAANANTFGAAHSFWFYPRAFNGPNGTVVGFSNYQLWELNPNGNGSVKLTGKLPFSPAASGSQVMYAPGKVLVASGGSYGPEAHNTASKSAAIIDFNGAKPKVTKTNNVLYPGNWLNLTVLPTGVVFANGGTKVGTAAGAANSDHTAEVWNPATGKWTKAATAKRTRTYHSTSLLMASGAVFTGGSGAAPYTDGTGEGPENNMNAELYYPAYLFTKSKDGTVHWAARPAITSLRGSMTYGGKVQLGLKDVSKIKSAALISLPTVTHSENTDQRRVPLAIKQSGKTVTATLPKSVSTLPPGDYELTVVDSKGVPSAAQIITIRKGKAGLVTIAS